MEDESRIQPWMVAALTTLRLSNVDNRDSTMHAI